MRELTISNKSIGIDVGSHSVKAVVAVKRGSSVIIKSFIEVPISPTEGPPPERVAQAVEELGKQLKVGSEVVVTSVSTQQATVRSLEIPFSEEEKARQILKFQTEPYLAFPIEEVIIDFYDTKSAPEGKMKVLLTAIHKGVIENHLELLSRAAIDPEVVDVDFMAISSTALWADPTLRETSAIVIDMSSSKTIACYIQEGKLLAVRCLPLGSDDLTRLGPELDRTVRYFSSQVRGGSFGKVILCGGSASLPGLDDFVRQALLTEVSVISPPDSIRNRAGQEMPFPRFATAVGLALRGLGEAPCLQNFRQEEHAYARPYRRLRKRLATSGVLVFLIAGLLVFSLFASIDRYSSKRGDLNFDRQTKRGTIFPDKTPQSNDDMRKLLEDEKKKLTPFRELRGNILLLEVFEDLSTKIPKEIIAELSLFNYTKSRPPELPSVRNRRRTRSKTEVWAGTLTLRGTVSTVADHEQLLEILEDLEYVGRVEHKGTNPAPNGRVSVQYTLRLKYARHSRTKVKETGS